MTRHTTRTLVVLGAALLALASSPARAQTSDRGFQLTTEVSTTADGPWGPSVTVPMFEPVFFRFTLTRNTGTSAEFVSLRPEDNHVLLFIKGAAEPEEEFESLLASTWVAKCTHCEPKPFLPGQVQQTVRPFAERIDSDGVPSYLVETPGLYTVASGLVDYDPNGLEVQASDVTIQVTPPMPGMGDLVRRGLLTHLQGAAKADEEGVAQRRQLESLLPRYAARPFVAQLQSEWRQMWPEVPARVDGALWRSVEPIARLALGAYLDGDAARFGTVLAPDATYNVALGRADLLRLLPAIRAQAAGASSWRLTDLSKGDQGLILGVFEILDSRAQPVQRWEVVVSADRRSIVSWRAL